MNPVDIAARRQLETDSIALKCDTALKIRELLNAARAAHDALEGDDADEDQFESDVLDLVTGEP